jgi:hypothetical protein
VTYDTWKTTNPQDELLGSTCPDEGFFTDFVFTSHGSIVTVDAHSDDAIDFARENFPVDAWQGAPEHFQTDWRVAAELCSRLASEGWRVEEC